MKKAAIIFLILPLFTSCYTESTLFKKTELSNSIENYQDFLRHFPRGEYKDQAKQNLITLEYEKAIELNSVEGYKYFTTRYPDCTYYESAHSSLVKLEFDLAKKLNTVESCEYFLQKYNDVYYGYEIAKMIKILNPDKAIIYLNYPVSIKVAAENGKNEWTTYFLELGGNVGYNLQSTDFYIQKSNGDRYTNSWGEKVRVDAGSNATVNYWCDGDWAGGYYHCKWVGNDDKGNPLEIIQKVRFYK
jgi:hypothetical protein